jgi:hypothetical protein
MRALIGLLLAVLSVTVHAGATYSSVLQPKRNATELLIPHRGAYWDPAQPGSGYVIDISRSSSSVSGYFGFATLYTYREDGTSQFLVLQGDIEFASEAQRKAEGWIARLSSPLFQAANGQPFGGAYRAPEVTPSIFGVGSITWKTRRTAELRVGDRVTPIRVVSGDTPVTEAVGLLSGFYTLQARVRGAGVTSSSHPASETYIAHVVKITPVVPSPIWALGPGVPGQTFWIPTSSVITFEIECVSECFPTNQSIPFAVESGTIYFQARIWVDPVTMRAGWVRNAVAPGQSTPHATQNVTGSYSTLNFDLYIDDETIVGRGGFTITREIASGGGNVPPGEYDGSELILTRIAPNGLHAPEGRSVKIY